VIGHPLAFNDREILMKIRLLLSLLVWGCVGLPGVVQAQTESGPKAGSRIEKLEVVAATGDDAGKKIDFAARRGNKPVIVVFVQADKWDRPTARFLRTLDQNLSKDRDDVQIIAVWLTDDVDKAKEYLPRAQDSLKLSQTTWSVYPGEKNGPPGWAINVDAHLTAVVVEDRKVTASFGYRSVNETDVPPVLKKLKPKK
jgi:hypothetical protein